jgi:hypothetical protein
MLWDIHQAARITWPSSQSTTGLVWFVGTFFQFFGSKFRKRFA